MGNQSLGAKLSNLMREAIANRRQTKRYPTTLQLRFSIIHQSKGQIVQKSRSVLASTIDVSRTGLSIKTNIVTVDGMHISVTPDSTIHKLLEIELTLPERKIALKAVPIRYVNENQKNCYQVGVKITAMPPDDRKLYESYLKSFIK